MNLQLINKRAIVTGGASGIGEAIAKTFLDNGAKVIVVDLPGKDVSDIYKSFENAYVIEQDITLAGASDNIIEEAVSFLGGLDILVNNAGIAMPSSLETTTDELWDKVMGLNVGSMFKISRAALPYLKKSGAGRIINLGSIMSDVGGPDLFVYGISKHAVAGMTKSMSVDLGQFGITANYLQPGAIVTALSAPFFADPAFKKYWEDKTPVGRLGLPHDVAVAALFLATDAAQFISGVGLNVDGGAIIKF
jgi:NAD(P)-dependent dehydrogenase (short-subunit alcohol dehydrogenase family)